MKRKPHARNISVKDTIIKLVGNVTHFITDYRKYVNSYAASALTFFIIILVVPAVTILALSASFFGIDLSSIQNMMREMMANEYTEMFISLLTTSKISFSSLIVIILSVYAVSRGIGNIYTISKDLFPSEEYREEENIVGYYLYTIRITVFLLVAFVAVIFMMILGPVGHAVNVFYGYLLLRYAILIFMIILFLQMLYMMIPNVKVKRRDALKGALVGTLGFFILYVITTIYFSLSDFSNVYGPLASIVMVFFVLKWGSECFYIGFYVTHLYYMKHQEMRVQEVVIERMTHFGDGVATIFGKPCYLRNVFTGEKVEVVVEKEGRRRTTGFVSAILVPSVVRDDPLCTQADTCRLCQLQYMNYLSQLTHKRSEMVRSLQRYTKFPYSEDVVWPVMPANDITGYRQYVSYPIYGYEGDTYIGSKDDMVCTFMADCQMQDDMIRDAMVQIQELIHEHHVAAYDRKTKKGLRYVYAKKIDSVMIIIFVTGKDGIPQPLIDGIREIPSVAGLHYAVNTGRNAKRYNPRNLHKIYGEDHFMYRYQGNEYRISAGSYVFITPEMEDNVIQYMLDILDPNDRVLSLYCKTGILELEMPNDVIAVDELASNIEDAQHNARERGLTNKTFICNNIDAEVALQQQKNDFDTIIVQLRTRMLSYAVAQSIHMSGAKNVYIISDDPHIFARSFKSAMSAEHIQNNYQLVSVMGIDIEPYTAKVQAVYQLVRKDDAS